MKSLSIKPSLLIFDLDDTLVSGEKNYDIALNKLGINPDDETYSQARQLVKDRLPLLAPIARSRFLYLKTYLELKGRYSSKESLELGEGYQRIVVELMQAQWRSLERDELMQKLRRHGYRTVVLTNETCQFQTKKIASFEQGQAPGSYFDFMITSEEYAREKPDHTLFLQALRHFNMRPDQALMIGDSFENDITPSLALGIPCVRTLEFLSDEGIGSTEPTYPVVTKLDQIADLLL